MELRLPALVEVRQQRIVGFVKEGTSLPCRVFILTKEGRREGEGRRKDEQGKRIKKKRWNNRKEKGAEKERTPREVRKGGKGE